MLVVDDNSPDGTANAVRALGERDPRVSVICRTNQRGYRIGDDRRHVAHRSSTRYNAILTLDADFSHDPADLPKLLGALADADVAVGSRSAAAYGSSTGRSAGFSSALVRTPTSGS